MHCDLMMRSRKSALELSCDATSTFQPTSGPMVLLLRLRACAFDEDGCDEDDDVAFVHIILTKVQIQAAVCSTNCKT